MIDPTDVIKFDRTEPELQEFWLFCCAAAGKTATTQARLLDKMLTTYSGDTPFEKIAILVNNNQLLQALKDSGLGQYNKLARCFSESISLNLSQATVAEFEAIYGVGSKTARFFLLYTRKDQRLAVLDTHMLKYLNSRGVVVPKASPSGKKYLELETKFLEFADASGMSIPDFDLALWKQYSGND